MDIHSEFLSLNGASLGVTVGILNAGALAVELETKSTDFPCFCFIFCIVA